MRAVAPRRRLRNYMIGFFVPLTVLPLIGLGVMSTALVQDAFNKQVIQRAKPELAAFQRNLEFVQRKLISDSNTMAKDEELRLGLLSKDKDVLRAFVGSNLYRSNFEQLKVFDAKGEQLQSLSQDVTKKWERLLEEINKESDGRGPSNEEVPESLFLGATLSEDERRLNSDFQSFLSKKQAWSITGPGADGRSVDLKFYRTIFSKKGKLLGYFEGTSVLDQKKLSLLSSIQGIELILLSASLEVLTASDISLESLFKKHKNVWASSVQRWWNADFKSEPYAFHFSKLKTLSAGEPLWVSAGISKAGLASLQKQIYWAISIFVVVMGILVCIVVIGVSNKITKPITEMVKAVDDIKEGKWVNPVEGDSSTEIGYLIKRFNDMASSVQVTKRMLETKLQELASAHSELKETQNQLVHSAKMSSLGQLVAGVAHELNNPIAFIYSNMTQMKQYMESIEEIDRLLQEGKGADDPKVYSQKISQKLEEIDWDFLKSDMEDIVQSCLEGSVRVKDIVLGLRNFSRADQSQFSSCDINHCLEETAKLLRGQLKNKAELHWELCADSLVHASMSQLNQVFMNLIANAAQAIEERGNIWISTRDLGQRVQISIRDDGPGISNENLDKVFDPFFTTKKVGDGTGLGLSIVYGIIQRHKGNIEVKSVTRPEENHGTEFVITLFRRLENDDDQEQSA